MKKVIYLYLLLAQASIIYAQNYNITYQRCNECTGDASTNQAYTFGPNTNYTTGNVASDFGRRRGVAISNWHDGIDYSAEAGDGDVGDHILTPVGGTISYFHVGNYKILVIDGPHNFGYGHIFRDGTPDTATGMRSGDLILKHMIRPNHLQYAIIHDQTGQTPVAFGTINGGKVAYNGDTLTVTNTVTANQVISPVGTSGGFAGRGHLHLYSPFNASLNPQNRSNGKNPLQFVSHSQPIYTVSIQRVNNLTLNGNNIFFSGSSNASIHARCRMNNAQTGSSYNNVTMNIDDIRLYIKKEFESANSYKMIKGAFVESKISLGGKNDSVRYPSRNNPTGNTSIDIATDTMVGSFTRTSIDPYAYDDQIGYPYDDYYFSDIKTRIHKNDNFGNVNAPLAIINEDARYPDGRYHLYVKGTTIRDSVYQSSQTSPTTILIDNFRPYVRKAELLIDGVAQYSHEWIWNGSALTYTPKDNCSCLWGMSSLVSINIYTSEPMQSVTLNVAGGTDNLTPVDNTRKLWRVNYPHPDPKHLWDMGYYRMTITGFDLAGNPLEGFTSTNDVTSFPVRQNNTTWIPAPLAQADISHVIHRWGLSKADFAVSFVPTSTPYTINFKDQSLVTANTWLWDFGDGTTSTEQSPSHVFSTTGTRNIVQKVADCGAPLTKNVKLILLPFISKVEIFKSGETTAGISYSRSFTNGNFVFTNTENNIDPNSELKIRFTASGLLKNINLKIQKEKNKTTFEISTPVQLNNSNCWEAVIPANTLTPGINTICISAFDNDNHKLLCQPVPAKYPCMIDNKNDNDTIGLTGTDKNYYLYVINPGSKDIQVFAEKSCSAGAKPKALFVNNSDVNYYVDFGDGSSNSLFKSHTVIDHYYPALQSYKAKFTRDYPANTQVTETKKIKF